MAKVLMLFSGIGLYGSERANLEVASALKRRGVAVRIVVSSAPWANNMREHLAQQGFDFITMPFLVVDQRKSVGGTLRNCFRLLVGSALLMFACMKHRPTHVLCGTQISLLSFLPALALLRMPLIYRSGDAPILHNWMFRLSWKLLRAKGRRFIAVSHFIQQKLTEHGIPPEKISVIYSKPPVRVRQGPAHDLPESTAWNEDDFVLTYIGQIREQKGVGLLVQAASRLIEVFPAMRINLAGRVSDWEGDSWARRLQAEVEQDASLSVRLRFLGFVEDVATLISSSDVVVVPTITEEPLANVVFESKQGGRPVIVFPSGGLPEVVEHQVDGFVCKGRTEDALVEAIRYYAEQPALVVQHGEQARRSLNKFGADQFDQTWANLFSDQHDE